MFHSSGQEITISSRNLVSFRGKMVFPGQKLGTREPHFLNTVCFCVSLVESDEQLTKQRTKVYASAFNGL